MPRGSGYRQPGNWRTLRRTILQRDNFRCYILGPDCIGEATTVDHIVPVAQGGTHHPDNLAAACVPCHDAKTEQERRSGLGAKQPDLPREPHPGVISRGA